MAVHPVPSRTVWAERIAQEWAAGRDNRPAGSRRLKGTYRPTPRDQASVTRRSADSFAMLVRWPVSCRQSRRQKLRSGRGLSLPSASQVPDIGTPADLPVRSDGTTSITPDPHTATRSSRVRPP